MEPGFFRNIIHLINRKDIDDLDFLVNANQQKKLNYKDRLEQDHTYSGVQGDYLKKREKWVEEK